MFYPWCRLPDGRIRWHTPIATTTIITIITITTITTITAITTTTIITIITTCSIGGYCAYYDGQVLLTVSTDFPSARWQFIRYLATSESSAMPAIVIRTDHGKALMPDRKERSGDPWRAAWTRAAEHPYRIDDPIDATKRFKQWIALHQCGGTAGVSHL